MVAWLFVKLTEVLTVRVFWELPSHSIVTSAYGLLSTLKLSATATRTQLQYLNLLSRSYAKLIENGWLPPELTEFHVGLPVSHVLIRFVALYANKWSILIQCTSPITVV